MLKELITSIRFIAVLLLLCCVLYPALIWVAGRSVFRAEAEGSLIERDGKLIGSKVIGQGFSSPHYFHGRPSAVGYNASGSAGSNLGPTNPALFARMADSVTSASVLDRLSTATIAFDRVTASGSGLDPDISPENARQQVARIAKQRGVDVQTVQTLVDKHTAPPLLGIFGTKRVNVLMLNLALDDELSTTGIHEKSQGRS